MRPPGGALGALASGFSLAPAVNSRAVRPSFARRSWRAQTKTPGAKPGVAFSARRLLHEAGVEAVGDQVLRQFDADEHHLAGLLLDRQPLGREVAAHHLVHALEHHLAVHALHVEHALVAQQALAVNLQDAAEEVLEAVRIERLVAAVDERLDLVVVVRMVVVMAVVVAFVRALAVVVIAIGVVAVIVTVFMAVIVMIVRVVVLVFGEEVGIDFELGVQVEAAQIEHFLDVRFAEIHLAHLRLRVHVQHAVTQVGDFLRVDEVGLRDEQAVGETDLTLHHFVLIELLVAVLGVDQRDDRVEQEFVGNLVIHEEGLRDRTRIREARGLDHDALEVELAVALLLREVGEHAREVAADRAADAAVAHLDDLLVAVLHENFVVDILFAEFVLDHGDLHAVVFAEDALEQRGLAAAEEAGQDGDGNHAVCHALCLVSVSYGRRGASARVPESRGVTT
ncbi:200 kDa antigen p200 [Paraburkholderia tropica]